MTTLKQCDIEELRKDPKLSHQFANYDHIMKICADQPPIPPISLDRSTKVLKSLKKNVIDFYSITPLHYLNAGQEGLAHYNYLLNAIISDTNNAKVEELNIANGNILFKGHNKDKNSHRSYRTIKSVDFYLRELYHDKWDNAKHPLSTKEVVAPMSLPHSLSLKLSSIHCMLLISQSSCLH